MSRRNETRDGRSHRSRDDRERIEHARRELEAGRVPPGAVDLVLPSQLFAGLSNDEIREMMREVFPEAREMSPEEFKKVAKGLPTVDLSSEAPSERN